MCGRYTLTVEDFAELAHLTGAEADRALADYYRPSYNAAPMQLLPIVRAERESRVLDIARWGLVNSWAKDNRAAARQINARGETVHERSAYRDAFRARRCLVPATGFYEWSGPRTKRQPHWIHPSDGGLFLFAGLFEGWRGKEGQGEVTFAIVTTDANEAVASIHDRMPAILSPGAAEEWLFAPAEQTERLRGLLVPAPAHLIAIREANPAVGNVRNDGPELIEAG